MCNACNNMCCGSDEFGGCGCDGCFEPECWSGDSDFEDQEDCAWCDRTLAAADRKAREPFCATCRGNLGVFICEAVP